MTTTPLRRRGAALVDGIKRAEHGIEFVQRELEMFTRRHAGVIGRQDHRDVQFLFGAARIQDMGADKAFLRQPPVFQRVEQFLAHVTAQRGSGAFPLPRQPGRLAQCFPNPTWSKFNGRYLFVPALFHQSYADATGVTSAMEIASAADFPAQRTNWNAE